MGEASPRQRPSALPFSLLLITDDDAAASAGRSVVSTIELALGDSAERVAVLLRCKAQGHAEVLQQARALRRVTERTGARLIVHTHFEVAEAVDAYGVHLVDGAALPRGDGRRWGASRHLETFQVEGHADRLSWVTLAPVFTPTSKPEDTRRPLGLDQLRACCAQSTVPVIALGGVTTRNIHACAEAGASAAAVLGVVMAAENPRLVVQRLLRAQASGERTAPADEA